MISTDFIRAFHTPKTLASSSLSARLDALEEFWDSEIPRISEPDAKGWDTWEASGKPEAESCSNHQNALATTNMDTDKPSDPYTRWAYDEIHIGEASSMPKRADEDAEDPFATVLYPDVRPLLIDIQTVEGKHALRLVWLEFLGLHIPGLGPFLSQSTQFHDDVWSQRHLSRPSYLRQLFPSSRKAKEREWDAYAGAIIAKETVYGPVFGCVREWSRGVFDPGDVLGDVGSLWIVEDVAGVDKDGIRFVVSFIMF